MSTIRIDEALWGSSMAPEGILDRWLLADGSRAEAGQKVAEVIIEGARHDILAPAAGRLAQGLKAGDLIEPGDEIGWLG